MTSRPSLAHCILHKYKACRKILSGGSGGGSGFKNYSFTVGWGPGVWDRKFTVFKVSPGLPLLGLCPWVLSARFVCFVGLLYVPATCECISGTDLLRHFTCCHTKIVVADQTFYLTQPQYTDTGPTSPCADPITPGAWQGSHSSANLSVTGMIRPGKIPSQARFEPGIFRSRGGRLNH